MKKGVSPSPMLSGEEKVLPGPAPQDARSPGAAPERPAGTKERKRTRIVSKARDAGTRSGRHDAAGVQGRHEAAGTSKGTAAIVSEIIEPPEGAAPIDRSGRRPDVFAVPSPMEDGTQAEDVDPIDIGEVIDT